MKTELYSDYEAAFERYIALSEQGIAVLLVTVIPGEQWGLKFL